MRDDLAPSRGDDCAADCALSAAFDRRRFLTTAMLAAAAAALSACGMGVTDPGGSGNASGDVTIANYPSLAAVGGIATLTLSGVPIAIVRTGDASFVALSRVCPHEGTIVNATSGGFTCPRHGARFSETGTWLGGQRTSSMHAYATSFDATSGVLTIG